MANDYLEPVRTAPADVKRIIERVLQLEKERLYEEKPHINQDIINIIKEAVSATNLDAD